MNSLKTKLFLALFVITITNILAQEITSFSSMWSMEYYQDDQKITRKDVKDLFSKNDEVYQLWKKADTKEIVAGVALVGEFVGVFWATSELLNDDPSLTNRDKAKNAVGPMAGGIAGAIVGIIYMNSANKSRKRAILSYNKQFDKKATFSFEPVANESGLGLAIKW
ncbi:hypothetical protein [uncultured Maribacter sp.]|uniref:hypothetical protein n=1 Tax=uncultured Maribacter sp. TaxID=431308 RepID=UPI0030DDD194|tara:strand:+ start:1971 stop:2468 length:498 start_codon:yes stop_codon:yes gene_type:complete